MKAHRRGILIILVTSSLMMAPSVFAQGKGGGNRGRSAGELPSGLNQYEGKNAGELPKGLEGQLEEEGSLPKGLETGGKKTSDLETKGKKKAEEKVEGKGPGF